LANSEPGFAGLEFLTALQLTIQASSLFLSKPYAALVRKFFNWAKKQVEDEYCI
jgi:hypothetical protein